jgi:cell division protein FtsL
MQSSTEAIGLRVGAGGAEAAADVRARGVSTLGVLLAAFVLILLVGLFHVWARVAILEQRYAAEAERGARVALLEERRSLTIEIRRLRDPARLEGLARQAGMRQPAPGQILLVEAP